MFKLISHCHSRRIHAEAKLVCANADLACAEAKLAVMDCVCALLGCKGPEPVRVDPLPAPTPVPKRVYPWWRAVLTLVALIAIICAPEVMHARQTPEQLPSIHRFEVTVDMIRPDAWCSAQSPQRPMCVLSAAPVGSND